MSNLRESITNASTDELFALVYQDHLTGLLNRRAFDVDARPHLAIIDLDSLKYVNDTWGHRWGDAQLVNLSCELVLMFGHDNVYRLSGDEFAVKSSGLIDDALFHEVLDAFPAFSYGLGRDVVEADARLKMQKEIREGLGLRAARGERPVWAAEFEDRHGVPYAA